MIVFYGFIAVWAAVCAGFFLLLVRATWADSGRCSCGGALGTGGIRVVHGRRTCYPALEAIG